MTPHQTNPIFSVNYKRLILQLLPTFLRKSRIYALCTSLVSGIDGNESVYDQFSENRRKNLNQLGYNGQVCHLRKLLNDELDKEKRRITITDNPRAGEWLFIHDQTKINQTLIHTHPSGEDRPISPIWDESKIDQDPVCFFVNVPADINSKELKKLLNKYKLISQRYEISLKTQNNTTKS